MGNNDLIQAICAMVSNINNQNKLRRIHNIVSRLFVKED